MKLLKFFLIAVVLFSATSAQTSIQSDLQSILTNINTAAANLRTSIVNSIDAALTTGLNALQTFWNTFGQYLASPSFANIINNAMNNLRAAISDNTAFTNALNTFQQNAQNIYQTALQVYYNATSSGAINCWTTARPQVLNALETYVSSVTIQSQQPIAAYQATFIAENTRITTKFAAYSAEVFLRCLNPFTLRTCRENYWNSKAAEINADFSTYRTNILVAKNNTLVALDQIYTSSAQTARQSLEATAVQFETCINAL